MTFETFSRNIRSKFGADVRNLSNKDGKYIAKLSGNIRIIGNGVSPLLNVRWGNCHSSVIQFAELMRGTAKNKIAGSRSEFSNVYERRGKQC
jgi:hypothetical protein